VAVPGLFISSGGKQGRNYLEWRSRKKKKLAKSSVGCKDGGVAGISHIGELYYKAPTNELLLSIIIVEVVVKGMVCTLSHL